MRNSLKFHLVLFLTVVIVHQSFGQKDFTPGFVVLPSGDTIKGLVDKSKPQKNFSRCLFKQRDEQYTTYSATELKGYGFLNGKRYESFRQNNNAPVSFAELVVEGPASLLYNGELYFVKKDAYQKTLPKPFDRKVNSKTGTFAVTIRSFRDTLRKVMADCQRYSLFIDDASYSYSSLYKVFENYNSCLGYKIKDRNLDPMIKFDYKLFAGFSVTTLKLSKGYFPELNGGSFDKSKQFTVGTGINFFSPRALSQLKVSLELFYVRNYFHGRSLLTSSVAKYHYEFFAEVSSVKIPFGVRYNLSGGSFTPFIAGGYSIEKLFKTSSYGTRESESFGVVSTENITIYSYRPTMTAFWASAGFVKKLHSRFSIIAEIRIEKTNGYFGPGVSQLSDVTAVSAIAGLQF